LVDVKVEMPTVPVSLTSSVPELVPDLLDIKAEPDPLVVPGLPSVFDPLPDSPKEDKTNIAVHHNDGN
jgi:hypothetical protein